MRTRRLLQDWERRSRRNPGAEHWAVTAVGPRSEEWGRLIVPRPPADPAAAKMVLERAAAALALHRMIERDRSGLQQQAQSGLIDDVLRSRITDESEAAARAHALGLRAAAYYLPAVVRVERHRATSDPVAGHRRNVALLDAVAHTVNAAGHTGLFSLRRDGEIGAVLSLNGTRPAGEHESRSSRWAKRCAARSSVWTAPQKSVLALAADVEHGDRCDPGLAEAAHVAEVALAMGGFAIVLPCRRRPAARPDLAAARRPSGAELRRVRAQTAVGQDDRGELSNVTVLSEYLAAAGNKAAAAERLHISRPALYKRLAAIRELLGVDLDDGESRTSLHVALLVLSLHPEGDHWRGTTPRWATRRWSAGRRSAETAAAHDVLRFLRHSDRQRDVQDVRRRARHRGQFRTPAVAEHPVGIQRERLEVRDALRVARIGGEHGVACLCRQRDLGGQPGIGAGPALCSESNTSKWKCGHRPPSPIALPHTNRHPGSRRPAFGEVLQSEYEPKLRVMSERTAPPFGGEQTQTRVF